MILALSEIAHNPIRGRNTNMELKPHSDDDPRDAIDGASPPPSLAPEDEPATEQHAQLTVVTDADPAPADSGGELTLSPPPIPPSAALNARLALVHRTNSFASNGSNSNSNSVASPLRLAAAANATSGGKPQQVFFIKTVRLLRLSSLMHVAMVMCTFSLHSILNPVSVNVERVL